MYFSVLGLLIISIGFACFISPRLEIYQSRSQGNIERHGFDYWKLAVQFQTGVDQATIPVRPEFSIHGLWPTQFKEKLKPSKCPTNETIDMHQLETVEARLNGSWPDLMGKGNKFWLDQWHKHGTCSKLEFKEYFVKSLELFDKLDLNKRLEKFSLKPAALDKIVSRLTLVQALTENHNSKKLELICQPKWPPHYLVKARFCYSIKFDPMDCPQEGNCRADDLLLRATKKL